MLEHPLARDKQAKGWARTPPHLERNLKRSLKLVLRAGQEGIQSHSQALRATSSQSCVERGPSPPPLL